MNCRPMIEEISRPYPKRVSVDNDQNVNDSTYLKDPIPFLCNRKNELLSLLNRTDLFEKTSRNYSSGNTFASSVEKKCEEYNSETNEDDFIHLLCGHFDNPTEPIPIETNLPEPNHLLEKNDEMGMRGRNGFDVESIQFDCFPASDDENSTLLVQAIENSTNPSCHAQMLTNQPIESKGLTTSLNLVKCEDTSDDDFAVIIKDVCDESETSSTSRSPSQNTTEDKGVMEQISHFGSAMLKSYRSQQQIHDWDRKMGLKRSHSKTMRSSMKTRSALRKLVEKESRSAKKGGVGKGNALPLLPIKHNQNAFAA